jgi:peptidoglycan/LPS O-acetylase OafA/YrhL
VLVHRYRDRLHIRPFWRRRFLLVGVPYVIWSVIYSGLALITTPVPPTAALIQLARNLLTGTAWYHLYFLVVTMQFYLLFPLFLRLLRTSAGRRGGHFALLAIGAVLQLGIDAVLHSAQPSGMAAKLLQYDGSFVGSYVFYLLLGGLAALHYERVQAWVRGHPVVVLGALLLTGPTWSPPRRGRAAKAESATPTANHATNWLTRSSALVSISIDCSSRLRTKPCRPTSSAGLVLRPTWPMCGPAT